MSFTGGITPAGSSYRGVSEAILKNCSFDKGASYGRDGITLFNDLTGTGGLSTYAGTGCTVRTIALAGGALRASMDGTADDTAAWNHGDNYGSYLSFSTTSPNKLVFETRIRKSSVANNGLGIFAGLAEEALAAASTLAATTAALADKDFIGFHVLQAAGGTVNFVWRKSGQTATTIIPGVATMTADTWVRLGFVIDPLAPASKACRVYVNGVEYASDAGTLTELAAATCPAGELLTPTFACHVGSGAAAATFDVDYYFAHQQV